MKFSEIQICEHNQHDMVDIIAKQYHVTPEYVNVERKAYSKSKIKQCFDNSRKYVFDHPDAIYVLGYYVFKGIPIEHCWVKEGSKYYEITLKSDISEDSYYSFYELTMSDLLDACEKIGYAPQIFEYFRFIRNKGK